MKKTHKTLRTLHLPLGEAGLIYRNGKVYTRSKHSRVNNPRTGNQQANRYKYKKVVDMWTALKGVCHNTFQNVDSSHSPYHEFLSINAMLGQCEGLPEVWISRGSLPPINYKWQDGRLVTDIKLGTLMIDDTTTVGEFSRAIVANNSGYEYDEELVFVRVEGVSEMRTDKKNAEIKYEQIWVNAEDFRVRLDAENSQKIFAISNGEFGSFEGLLCNRRPLPTSPQRGGEQEGIDVFPLRGPRLNISVCDDSRFISTKEGACDTTEGSVLGGAFYRARNRGRSTQKFSSQQLLKFCTLD